MHLPIAPDQRQHQHPDQIDFQRKKTEEGSRWTALSVTVLIHIFVIVLLAWIILDGAPDNDDPIEIHPAAQGKEDPVLDKEELTTKVRNSKPSRPSDLAAEVMVSTAASPISMPSIEVEPSDDFGSSNGDGFGNGGWGDGDGSPDGDFGPPPEVKGRCNQTDRIKRLRENGGTAALDRKVTKALDWLAEQQNEDGSWGTAYPVAMTGFALLAFSGHCETVDSPKYGEKLAKAINFLVDKARTNGGMMASAPGQYTPYEHGIATYALAESYALNKNARRKVKSISGALRKAVPVIIENQTEGGGWLYNYGSSGNGDLSISGWNIQALKAAKLTNLRFRGHDRAMQRARGYLDMAAMTDGKYKYRIREADRGRHSLTGVGLLCGRMLGKPMANERAGLDAILAQKPRQFRATDPYALYYHSQACFQVGGKDWDEYNRSYQKLVIDSQEKDGSWPAAAGHIGAAAPDVKIYHTCLCTLMLEVYYRYLPASR